MSRSSSAVVDSKVVEMSLDNQNFEKNAQISMSTLKKLQEALDFSNSSDGLDRVNASVKKVKFDSLISGVDKAKGSFSALETVAFGAFANIGAKISDLALKIGTAIPRQIIEGGKARAFNVEQAKFQIEGLAKQTGVAFKDVEETIRQSVADTAYGFDEAAVAASQLLASSVQAGDELQGALNAISGVTAMTGANYGEISHIFTTIAGQGRVMTEQLNQLSTRGINAAATLADQLGMTEEEVRDLVHKGQIDFQTFADAMDSAFGDHAKEANKTFTGAFSNIKAVFSRIGQKFIAPGMDAMVKVFNHLLPLLKEVEARIGVIADMITPYFDVIANGVSGAIDTIYTALTGKDPVKDAAEEATEATEKAVTGIDKIRKAALEVIQGKYGNGKNVRFPALEAAGYDDPQAVQDYVNKLWELNGQTWELTDAVLAETDAFFGNYDALSKISDEDLKAAGMSDEDVKNLRESAKALEDQAEAAGEAADQYDELDNKSKFVLALRNAFEGFKQIFSDIGKSFKENFKFKKKDFDPIGFLASKFLSLTQTFNTFAQKHGKDIANIFLGIVSAVQLVWKGVTLVGKAFLFVASTVLGVFGVSIIELVGWVGSLITKFNDWIKNSETLRGVIDWLRTTIEGATTKVKDFFDGFIKIPKFYSGLKKIEWGFKSAFKNFPKHLEGTKKAFGDFKDRVKEMGGIRLDNIVDIFKAFKDTVVKQFLDFKPFEHLKQGFVDVTTTIREHFEEMSVDAEGNETTFGKVYHAIGKGFDWIGEKAEKVKTKVLEWWDSYDIGGFLSKQWTNFSMGLEQLGSHLIKFFTGLPAQFGNFWDLVQQNGGFSFSNLGNIWQAFKDTIGQYFKDFHGFDGLKGAWAVLKEDFVAKLKEMGVDVDGWKEKILGWKDNIVKGFQDFKDFLKDFNISDAFKWFIGLFTGGNAYGAEVDGSITEAAENAESATGGFSGFIETIKGLIGDGGWIVTLGKFVVALLGIKTVSGIGKSLKEIAGGLAEFLSGKAAVDKAEAKDIERQSKANMWLKFAAGVALIAYAIAKVGTIEVSQLEQGAKVVGVIAVALLAFSWLATKLVGAANIEMMGDGLLKFAGAIAAISLIAVVLNLVPWDVLMGGLKKVAVVGALLIVASYALALSGRIAGKNDVANVATGLDKFVGAIAKVAAMAVAIALVPWETLQNGLKKLAIIGGMLLTAVFALSIAARIAGGKGAIALGGLALTVGAIAGILYLLGEFGDADKYLTIAEAISMIVGTLAASMAAMSLTGAAGWASGAKLAVNIIEFIGIIGGVAAGLQELGKAIGGKDFDLLGSLGDIFGKLGEGIGKFIGGIAVGAANKMDEIDDSVIDKMVGFIQKIADIKISPQEIKKSEGLFGASSDIDKSLKSFAKGMSGVISAINSLSVSDETGDLEEKVKYFTDIADFVKQLAAIEIPEQVITDTVGWGLIKDNSVDKSLEKFAEGINGVVKAVNLLETPPDDGDLARKKQYMASVVGFVGGLADITIPEQYIGKVVAFGGVFQSYAVDKSLESFGDGIKSVVKAVNTIEISPLDILLMGVKKQYMEQVVEFVEGLAGVEIPVQYVGKFTFLGISYAAVDKSLQSFGEGMEAVVKAVNELRFDAGDIATMNKKKKYMDNIADFTKRMAAIDIPVQVQQQFGEKSFFSSTYVDTSLKTFGEGLAEVVTAVNGLEFDVFTAMSLPMKAVYFNIIADFVKAMANIDIPTQKTDWSALNGLLSGGTDSSLYTFATGMKEVAVALNGMKKPNVSQEDISFMASAVETMATAAAKIPAQNEGLTAWLSGNNSLSNFANEMKEAAAPIKAASDAAKGIKINRLQALSNGVGEMSIVISKIVEKSGSDVTYFSSHLSEVTAFAGAIEPIGKGLGKLSKLKDINVEDIHKIPDIIDALIEVNDKLKEAQGAAANAEDSSLQNIMVPFEAIGEATSSDSMPDSQNISSIVAAVNELQNLTISGGDGTNTELVTTLKTNVESLRTMIDELVTIDTSGVDKLTSATEKLGKVDFSGAEEKLKKAQTKSQTKQGESAAKEGINAMASVYQNDKSVSGAASSLASGAVSAVTKQAGAFKAAGRQLVSAIAEGINQKNSAKDAAVKIVSKAASAAKGESDKGNEAGAQFAKGYARGIDVNTSYVASVARAMVKKAAEAAKKEQDSASPSKLTYKFGKWFVEGYSNAIGDYASMAEKSAGNMTKGTVSAMGDALNAVSDLIGNSDDYTPTITPILDLSEVENRAAGLNGLFNASPTIGASLGVVAANSTAMRQSTSMTDLLTAMEDLSVAVGSASPVNNYTVNGVTYDDGSNVANAVGDLIRAARIERRA